MIKPYQQILIVESGESLISIPLELFAVESPHPYEKLGAPYGKRSPYHLRQTALENLIEAQNLLQQSHPNWRIQIFDAYRPIEVQKFMVEYTFAELLRAQNLNLSQLSDTEQQKIWEQVYQFWAYPSPDPATPPPHSTGGAIDITLVNEHGNPVNMGTAIDEVSPLSYPDYFANSDHPIEQQYHAHRQLLWDIMGKTGFQRHPNEWWHFSFGDQMWAWLSNQADPNNSITAKYGKV